MNFKELKKQSLTEKELKTINAGVSTDCNPGDTKVGKGGLIWVCSPTCEWVLPNPDDTGDTNGGGGY